MPSANATQVRAALDWLRRHATRQTLDGMARYGLPSDHAFGVSMRDIQALGRQLGSNYALATALWTTGNYEARMLAALVDDPAQVTSAQMDRWCRDFDNWGVCDTMCFKLFDRTPHAWAKVAQWSTRRGEFERRAAFALLASLAGHDRTAADAAFLDGLRHIERAATDERNLVKKGVSWALRRIGWRNAALNAAAVQLARQLAASPDATARWIGNDALRDITRPAVTKRFAA
jgi:3-methyladenine DNA glycosylase AlkD